MRGEWHYDIYKHTHREAMQKAERRRLVRLTAYNRPEMANYTPVAVRLGRFLIACGQRLEARYSPRPAPIEMNFLAQ
jgi:hypothetical protein